MSSFVAAVRRLVRRSHDADSDKSGDSDDENTQIECLFDAGKFLDPLPDALKTEIFSQLLLNVGPTGELVDIDALSLVRCRSVCVAWRDFLDSPEGDRRLWRSACAAEFGHDYCRQRLDGLVFFPPHEEGVSAAAVAARTGDAMVSRASDSATRLYPSWRACFASETTVSVDDFELLNVIGKGAFGKVLQVRSRREHGKGGKLLAMRIFRQESERERATRKRISTALRRVSHPNVLKIVHVFEGSDQTKLYVLSEYAGGGTMDERLRWLKRLDEGSLAACAGQLVLALDALRASPGIPEPTLVMPEHLLIGADGNCLLNGVALPFADEGDVDNDHRRGSHLASSEFEYCPPEMLTSAHFTATPASARWNLGVLMFDLATGSPPFYHEQSMEAIRRVLEDTPEFPAYMSSELRDLLGVLLAKDPAKRVFPSCGDDLRAHPFFAIHVPRSDGSSAESGSGGSSVSGSGFFDALEAGRVPPPFEPNHPRDGRDNDPDPEFCENPSPRADGSAFAGFTYEQ
jgi:serine/threonine protein kinase